MTTEPRHSVLLSGYNLHDKYEFLRDCLYKGVKVIWFGTGEEVRELKDDFKEFTSKCKSRKVSPDVRMTIEEREADLISRGKGGNITDGLRKMWQEEIDTYGNMIQEKLVVED